MLGASLPLAQSVDLVLSLHAYLLFWEHPASAVIKEVNDDMVVRSFDPGDDVPLSLGAGFRFQL
jgi:hypothetical protein